MSDRYEACAPDGIGRVVRWPMERIEWSPHGLKYKTFAPGEILTAEDLSPRTNIAALVAGGHLRPVAAKKATKKTPEKTPENEEAV